MGAQLVLIHSPLVGRITWARLAEEFRRRGSEVLTPALVQHEGCAKPYWTQDARSVARALEPVPKDRSLILVGHSGAGPLLPSIRQAFGRPVGAYLFVDAGLPRDGQSRLQSPEAAEFAPYLRELYAAGGRFPNWTDEDLKDILPDTELRQRVLAELRPQPWAFWVEPIPVFDGWPDAPCAYLQFSPSYDKPAERAQQQGWPYRRLNAGHFHMLVDPAAVADALLALTQQSGSTLTS